MSEVIADILREMRAWTVDTDGLTPEEVSLNVSAFADRIEAAHNREQVTNRNHLNGAKKGEVE